MNFFKQNQTAILVIVIIIVAFFAYTFFFTGSKEEGVLESTEVSVATPQDQDLITLLLELKAISLDEKIFSDAAFKSLVDFSQQLVTEPVGKTNPFAPLGQAGIPAPSTQTVSAP